MAKVTVADLIARNKEVAKTWQPLPTLQELNFVKETSAPYIAIVTCMDARIDWAKVMALTPGDALVIRNTCGHVKEVLRDLVVSDVVLGIEEVAIIHHTDCGALAFSNADVAAAVRAYAPATADVSSLDFGAIDSPAQSVIDDVKILKDSPFVRQEIKDSTTGFVFDIKTGLLTSVDLSAS